MSIMHCSLLSLGCVFGVASTSPTNLTALKALGIAQRRLRPEVRAKLINVSSSRTDSSLVPDAWRFTFRDDATSGNKRYVTVAAKTSSEHPDTVEAFNHIKGENDDLLQAIPQNILNVDSNQVLELAIVNTHVKGAESAQYRLLRTRRLPEPVWTLLFYSKSEQPIASVNLGAKTGTIRETIKL